MTAEERQSLRTGKALSDRARECVFIGYPNTPEQSVKNSYMVRTRENTIVIRHDCYFQHYTDYPSLLHADVNMRDITSPTQREVVTYDELLGG